MRFLVDAQLPPALARMISAEGHDAIHVGDVDMLTAADRDIFAFARREVRVVITKDEDFSVVRSGSDDAVPAVVWIRVGNTTRRSLLSWFAPRLDDIVELIDRGERLVEVR